MSGATTGGRIKISAAGSCNIGTRLSGKLVLALGDASGDRKLLWEGLEELDLSLGETSL